MSIEIHYDVRTSVYITKYKIIKTEIISCLNFSKSSFNNLIQNIQIFKNTFHFLRLLSGKRMTEFKLYKI